MSGPAIAREFDLLRTTFGEISCECLHVAIDDTSRLACTDVLANKRSETACAFGVRAIAWFERHGVTRRPPDVG